MNMIEFAIVHSFSLRLDISEPHFVAEQVQTYYFFDELADSSVRCLKLWNITAVGVVGVVGGVLHSNVEVHMYGNTHTRCVMGGQN